MQETKLATQPNNNEDTNQAEAAEHLAEAMRMFNDAIRKADQAGLTIKAEIVNMWRQKKVVPLISVSTQLPADREI